MQNAAKSSKFLPFAFDWLACSAGFDYCCAAAGMDGVKSPAAGIFKDGC
jgi:elongation factor P hydroxylase